MRANDVIAIAFCGMLAASIGAAPAWAQSLYKHVDANGKVTYTDLPQTPEEKQLEIANTARNGDGGAARTKADKKKLAQQEKEQQKAKGQGQGQKQPLQKRQAKRPDPDSQ
jgi:hypothetical protein